ncbi:2-hydroxy-6-oxononadienedioate/2-hydroxy-6-oxononatrienedioate hydrolase [bacterium BMS3Bbin10]|nr:2-hydroxy-6-oxononadienedioate/2-hydroxy-6-oxononatrienedioate hydrolase [bacterium BMS3Bbin10]
MHELIAGLMIKTVRICVLLLAGSLLMSCSGAYQSGDADVRYATVGSDTQKVRLAYRDRGTGQAVLLLHGFGASSYTWRHVEPALTASGYRVVTLDLKGFGLSEKPFDDGYSIFDQAALVSQFIDQIGLKKVTVIGHSLGGGVALVLALDNNPAKRKRIAKLVLINSIAYAQNIPIAFSILRTPVLGEISSRLVPLDVQTRVALKLAYFDDSKFDSHDVKQYSGPLKDKGSRHALIQTARQILPKNLPELSSRYKTIKIPALIIWCDRDKVIKPRIGLRLRNDLPNSTLRIMRRCGHMPQEERPQQTVELMQEFLKR